MYPTPDGSVFTGYSLIALNVLLSIILHNEDGTRFRPKAHPSCSSAARNVKDLYVFTYTNGILCSKQSESNLLFSFILNHAEALLLLTHTHTRM